MENENKESNERKQPPKKQNNYFRKTLTFVLIIVFLICLFWMVNSNSAGKEVSLSNFYQELNAGHIDEIYLNAEEIKFKTKDGEWFWFHSNDSLKVSVWEDCKGIENLNVKTGPTTTVNVLSFIYPILLIISLLLLVVFTIRQIKRMNSKSMDFTKNRARVAVSKVKFDKVAGADEEKQELEEIIQFLKDPDKFTKIGARIPKGVLLVGPPGTGKTLLAKAVAGEANVPFFTMSGSDFMELYVGVGASRVRDLFENAKRAKPCIVFIDEIDAVGRQRGTGLGGGNDEREQTLNQLLVQMDGFETNEGIIVMAATNRADILDPALTRPGRFDRQIYISAPDVKGREEILRVHSEGKPLSKDVKLKEIARVTSGFTGADLENLLNEAAILAARQNHIKISMEDINNAIVKVQMGPQKKSRIVTESDRKITAYHEAGHAVVEKCVKNSNPVHEVSIIQRGGAAGYTISRPENDDSHMTKQKLIDLISMMLGGRVSEELFLDDITTGASSDINRATNIARKMVTDWGMSSEIGLIHYGSEGSELFLGRDYQTRATYSEKEAAKIDDEIKKIIDNCYKEAKKILTENKDKIETMVAVLLEKETIYSDEVDMIMQGSSKDDVIKYIDDKAETRKRNLKSNKENETETQISADDFVNNLLKEAQRRAEEKESAIVSDKEDVKIDEENKDLNKENKTEEKNTEIEASVKEEKAEVKDQVKTQSKTKRTTKKKDEGNE